MDLLLLSPDKIIKQGAEARVYKLPLEHVIKYFERRDNFVLLKGENSETEIKKRSHGTIRGELQTDFSSIHRDDVTETSIIIKERFSKKYRHPTLDAKLTKKRVLQEGRALRKLTGNETSIPVPIAYGSSVTDGLLFMELIQGVSVKAYLDALQYVLDFLECVFGIPDEDFESSEDNNNEDYITENTEESDTCELNTSSRYTKKSKLDEQRDNGIDPSNLIETLKTIVFGNCNYNTSVVEFLKIKFNENRKLLPADISYNKFICELYDVCCLFSTIGKHLGAIHVNNMIHGDLTTSNLMIRDTQDNLKAADRIVFIDFGLSFNTNIIEDKAVDLYVLERTLVSSHHNSQFLFKILMDSYLKTDNETALAVQKKFDQVRLRGRKRTECG